MTQALETEIYGKPLSGAETEIERARLARIQYLKKKMRPRLEAAIGDLGDNITDAVRALVLGQAIQLGVVSDPAAIDEYKAYIEAMLAGYGGEQAIMPVLNKALTGLQAELVAKYYQAKMDILASESVAEINAIDLPGEPETVAYYKR